MKKIKRLLIIFILTILSLTLISCQNDTIKLTGKTFDEVKEEYKKDNESLIGALLVKDISKELEYKDVPSGKFYYLYQENYKGLFPDGDYILVYSNEKVYPSIQTNGMYFAGVYKAEGESLVRTNEIVSQEKVLVRSIDYLDATIMSVICILIVFLILIIIALIVSLFKFMKTKEVPNINLNNVLNKQSVDLKDITDPDMQVAAVVASIDYHEQIKKDIRIKSIKEIK